MNIISKEMYRDFLKTEDWQQLRIKLLEHFCFTCVICGKESASNDIHHVVYPENWWNTSISHVVCLCRPCHDRVHLLMKDRPKATRGLAWRLFNELRSQIRTEIGIPADIPRKTKKLKKKRNVILSYQKGVHLEDLLEQMVKAGLTREAACTRICDLLISKRIHLSSDLLVRVRSTNRASLTNHAA